MERYISLKQALDDILVHPLLKDVSFERAVNYAIHFMRIVGCPRIFSEKTAVIDIKDYRGLLPCDFIYMIQVRLYDKCHNMHNTFRYSTDSFHMTKDKQNSFDFTYKLQNNIIFTSLKEGKIEIVYESIPVDSEGYPLIPDNSSFITALELYIKKQVFTILFDLGKIAKQVYDNVSQEYAWYVGQAQSDMIRPSIDQMESLSNMLNTLIPRVTEHKEGFVNAGTQEKLRVV